MPAQITNYRSLGQGKWIQLREINYIDDIGRNRTWETADRLTPNGAVAIIAHLIHEDAYLFVDQFRPPLKKHSIEFPAGLIDIGENASQAGIRELYEETGYQGKLHFCTPQTFSSPGLSGESITFVQIEIDTQAPENQNIIQHLDEGELITVHQVRKTDIANFIQEYTHKDYAIDSKIIAFFFHELSK